MTIANPVLETPASHVEKKGLKISINKAVLIELIGRVQNAVPSKPVVPILSNILLQARQQELVLVATDLTVGVKVYGEAQVLQEGSIVLSAKKFFQLIRELTTSLIEIEVHGSMVTIKAGASLFKLHGIASEEFPEFQNLAQSPYLLLHGPTLKELLVRTSFAVAKDDSRHILNGVYLQLMKNELVLIGTDGKKLSKISADLDSQSHDGNYIIPIKAVEEMIRCLDEDQGVKMLLTSDKLSLETSSATITTKLLSGEYPDVNRVIPKKANVTVSLHREELMVLLRQVALFTSEINHSVRFTFKHGELELSAVSNDVGEGKVVMPIDYFGDTLEIAFNPYFFIDILKHCKDETVSFGLIDSFNPGLITDQTTALFVIMPMRLSPQVG